MEAHGCDPWPLRFASGRHLREALWNFENKNILFMLPFF